jgi:regulator of protease activity HflC (stomatin/prohibitin superfamily)
MEFIPLYWHWLVFGMLLMMVEIALPSFTALWFGLGALVVGVILLVLPDIPTSTQIFIWVVLSSVFTWLWFKYLKPRAVDKTMAGLSREAIIGESGQVISLPQGDKRGELRFSVPVLGAEEWAFICSDEIAIGDRVTVTEVSGNTVTIGKGVRLVPQGHKWVVQRLGKYHQTLNPGLNFVIPYVDNVAYKVTTKDIVLDIPSQEVITRDNAVIIANAVAYMNIVMPEKAVYGVEDYQIAIQTLVQTSLRSIVGEMALDDALSSRDQIKAKLKSMISDDISDWGITLKTVEIQDINPSMTMQQAMEEQAAAERARRATVTRAEGEKEAAILQADGRYEAAKRDAQAQVVLAEASQRAIQKVTEAIESNELPVMYLLGERYIEAIKDMSVSENGKLVVIPADIPAAVRGLMGNAR